MAQRLKFSYGITEGVTYVYIHSIASLCPEPLWHLSISWHNMLGAVWGGLGGKSDWWVITGRLLLPASLTVSRRPHLLTRESSLADQLVASAKVPVMKIGGPTFVL